MKNIILLFPSFLLCLITYGQNTGRLANFANAEIQSLNETYGNHIISLSKISPFWELADASFSELILGVYDKQEPSEASETKLDMNASAKMMLDIAAKGVDGNKAIVKDGIAYVKYNLEGGTIAKGDYITISCEPGVGMKATEEGFTVGVALENSNDTEKVGLLKIRVLVRYEKFN